MALPSENACAAECKKDALRQNQDGTWKLTVNVAPGDMPTWLLTADMGARLQLAIVQIGDDEEPVPQEKERPQEKTTTRFADMRRPVQAGILCSDPNFARWFMGQSYDDYSGDKSALMAHNVRSVCKVKSRSELDSNTDAAHLWDSLVADYRVATGRDTEER